VTSDIERKLDDHELRLRHLEALILTTKSHKGVTPKPNYKGLNGGIEMLIENKYFQSPKEAVQIIQELKREGYHYAPAAVRKALGVYFTKDKKILTRIRQDSVWLYAIRK
jgi:hypothetical protein